MQMSVTQNEFLNLLVNKIAMQIVHTKQFKNPLAVLKKGSVPLGKNLEEIYTNPTTGKPYDPTGKGLLDTAPPEVMAIYHTRNRQGKHEASISVAQLMSAFTSYGELENLVNSIVNAIYSGDNLEEFMLMKELFASAITGGKIKKVSLGMTEIVDEKGAKSFVKDVKKAGLSMAVPSTGWNSYYNVVSKVAENPDTVPHAITWSPIESQILLLRNDVSVDVDVELLAKAFQVSYTDLKQRTLLVDGFGSATNCGAILCDESFVRVYDNFERMEEFRNGDGLFDKYMYHHWQTYSLSLFANACAFMFDETETETETE